MGFLFSLSSKQLGACPIANHKFMKICTVRECKEGGGGVDVVVAIGRSLEKTMTCSARRVFSTSEETRVEDGWEMIGVGKGNSENKQGIQGREKKKKKKKRKETERKRENKTRTREMASLCIKDCGNKRENHLSQPVPNRMV